MKQKIFRSLFYIFGFYVLILAGVQMSGSGNLGLTNGRLADPPESPNCVSSHADVNDTVHYIEPLSFSGSIESASEAIQKVIEQWPRTKIIKQEENYYHLELPIEAVRVIHTGLTQAVNKWAGGDPMEQEDLQAMRDHFYRIILEHRFDNM